MSRVRSAGSIVIPAHDEATVIGRTLDALAEAGAKDWEVVVVCNGCSDATAEQARRDGVTVLEIPEASKTAALNRGDEAVSAFPRVYLDADIVLSPRALADLRSSLDDPAPRLSAPRLHVELEGCSPLVRSFYRIYLALPYLREGLAGAGVYAVNEPGRRRFERFPGITADDMFVQGLFAADEREVAAGSRFHVRAPRTLRSLLAVRTRSYAGVSELARSGLSGSMQGSRSGSLAALRALVLASPARLPDAAVYVAVNLLAARRARRRTSSGGWLRDSSTRT